MASDGEALKAESFKLHGDCLKLIGDIIIQASNPNTFKAIYPNLKYTLRSVENSLEKITEAARRSGVPAELSKWVRNGFNFAKYYVEAMKDIQSMNFDACNESTEKAKMFLEAFISDVPEPVRMLEELKEPLVSFKTTLQAFEFMGMTTKAGANLAQGNYKEAVANFQSAIHNCRQIGTEDAMRQIGGLEANLRFAEGMNYQYDEGNFLEASKAFEESSRLFKRLADNAELAEDVFLEGTFRWMKHLSEQRASMCITLYNKVGKKPEYNKVREEISKVQKSFWEG